MRKNKTGFTLIELLVVVLIIGILAAVALPQYQLAVDKSRFSQALAWAKAIKEAEEVYKMANASYTPNLEDLDIDLPNCEKKAEGFYLCADGFRMHFATGSSVYVYLPLQWVQNQDVGIEYYFHNDTRICFASSNRFKKVCKSMGGTQHPNSSWHFILP